MRISPKSLSPAEALAKAQAKSQARDEARHEDQENESTASDISSPAAIDAGRAQRLLERAASLGARGDMGAAILATRQSLALAHDNVEAHLLHARLLERSRDFVGARDAYEKGAQIAPERTDARDNLVRLNTYLENSQDAASQFHFDSNELFSPTSNETAQNGAPAKVEGAVGGVATPVVAASVLAQPAAPVSASPASEINFLDMLDESMLPSLPSLDARLPPSRSDVGMPDGASASRRENNGDSPAEAAFVAQSDGAVAPVQVAAIKEPADDRRKHNMPVATERRRRPVEAAAVPLAPVIAAPVVSQAARAQSAVPLIPSGTARNPLGASASRASSATRAPLAPVVASVSAPDFAAPLWQQVITRPSFYARTLPLVGVALLSLGFLSWARGRAVSNLVAPVPTELASNGTTPFIEQPATVPGTTLPVPNAAAQPGAVSGNDAAGFPISNAPAVFQAPPSSGAGATNANSPSSANARTSSGGNAPSTTARASNRGPNSNSGSAISRRILPPARPVPNFPGVSLAPAPIPPASVRNTISGSGAGASSGGSNIILPSPSIEMPSAPEPRQRVLPPMDNGLNPAGSPNRGYVRVTEGRVGNGVIPSQPSAVARDNERAANDAARNGQNDQAISQLSQAIRADSDNAAFRYQQRATLFLQRGDYSRATDDFQSAISAYQSQISSGNDVAQAKRGLNSARSGLTLALAGKRG